MCCCFFFTFKTKRCITCGWRYLARRVAVKTWEISCMFTILAEVSGMIWWYSTSASSMRNRIILHRFEVVIDSDSQYRMCLDDALVCSLFAIIVNSCGRCVTCLCACHFIADASFCLSRARNVLSPYLRYLSWDLRVCSNEWKFIWTDSVLSAAFELDAKRVSFTIRSLVMLGSWLHLLTSETLFGGLLKWKRPGISSELLPRLNCRFEACPSLMVIWLFHICRGRAHSDEDDGCSKSWWSRGFHQETRNLHRLQDAVRPGR